MWVVDTCVVLDVFENDPSFGVKSAQALKKHITAGLLVSPVTMIELSIAFDGDLIEQKRFLDLAGIAYDPAWTADDVAVAHSAWHACILARRKEGTPLRPVADIIIGGFAATRSGLITRNPGDFKRWFPKLKIISP